MAYTALYRKFRPDTFDEVKGQAAVVTTLRNQVRNARLSHAYLFCGTRGTGKTTMAKILAKAANCEAPQDGNPCGSCAMCQAIAAGTSMNVIEIDAASNTSVDNVREIVEEVRYSPTEGHFKVYIIDEVHMLSSGAFNALLKTLEEPPEYVMFILATTEAHKIPITILSRCQRYDFTRITVEEITERLTDIAGREGISAEDKALRYIARVADGAMRDALSLLDRCIAGYQGEILTYDNVLDILGTVDVQVFGRLILAIRTGDAAAAIKVLEEAVLRGRDLSQFISDFTWYLRNLLLARSVEHPEEFLDISSEQLPAFLAEAEKNEPEVLIRYIHICSDLLNRIRYAGDKRVQVEITMIRMCRPESDTDYNALVDRIRHLEEQLANGVVMQQAAGAGTMPEPEPKEEVPVAELPRAMKEDIKEIAAKWQEILQGAKGRGYSPLMRTYLEKARVSVDDTGNYLLLVYENTADAGYVRDGYLQELCQLVAEKTGKAAEIKVECAQEGKDSLAAYADLSVFAGKVAIDYTD